jgi:hypothetical protein
LSAPELPASLTVAPAAFCTPPVPALPDELPSPALPDSPEVPPVPATSLLLELQAAKNNVAVDTNNTEVRLRI